MTATVTIPLPTIDSGDVWMTRKEVAAYAKTSPGTLATMGYEKKGPRFYKPTGRKVVYKKSDVDAWLGSNAGRLKRSALASKEAAK
ncbi:AlpA family transcriptional regulator [Bifidobacterium sp. UTBIF-68]|uniref:helix-turn-helix transcriptional regulator n=1 Tax=Bifidobacterium sp. UTBIF-68 TaxID=1465262 RepID=UPI001C61275E|nr:helix-turn-helix domain-containing protein [Bifidobacterium sp. UTBIF-68]